MTPDRLVQLSVLESRATTEETQWLLNRIGELEASNVELTYCRTCRHRHIVRRREEGRGYRRVVLFSVYCPKRDTTYVPMRALADFNRWMPI